MHQQLSSKLSDGGSPGKLAAYTRILADEGMNIRSIGGAEWDGTGGVGVLLDNDLNPHEMDLLIEKLNAAEFPTVAIFTAEAVIDDQSGALADALELIGDDVNISTILVADSHRGHGLVTFGFEDRGDARKAQDRLGGLAVGPHGLTAAWQAHEDWDASNPNPEPDPHNPNP